ncbi:MAG: glycoside hydrolase family 3 C-terminal domain-containing protein, partial [Oscillospiraceae bacterium]|nr:glycoside hydrolase family 3 C-terminal domain-containing protein [Oscillospiraceae bacterium]
MGNKISILEGKELNLDCIEGRFAAFAKHPYAVTLRLSQPIAEDGYGVITVDGVEIPKGTQFLMDVVVKMHCLMVPVGSVAREYGKEYTMKLTGFKGKDGKSFPDTTLKFKTMERPQRDHKYDAHDEVAIQAAREGMVLLRNESNVLPLQENTILNCFGAAQYMFRNTATGAGLINPRWQANFHQSIEEHSSFKVNRELSDLYTGLQDVVPTEAVLNRAKEQSDTAIILVSRHSGEFSDNRAVKGGYYLSDDERAMIAAVSKVFPKTV